MALDIVVTTDRYHSDPISRGFIDYVRNNQKLLHVDAGVLYYDFPAYVDYETETTRPDVLLFSPEHGFTAIRFIDDTLFVRSKESVEDIDRGLNDFCSNLYSRLIRSRELRLSRTKAIIDVHPLIFDTSNGQKVTASTEDLESGTCSSYEQFSALLDEWRTQPISTAAISEVRSVVEGAKALSRPTKRQIDDPVKQPLAVAMAALEAEIANFDQKQRHIALVDVGGPARIRGLAGSGKTVILAMKVAHLHLNNPSAKILITFLTKSLRATIKTLITKFYRHYSENDPDWKTIHIRHGWGGSSLPGVYSDACKRVGIRPLNLSEAQAMVRGRTSPFEAICANLIDTATIKPFYDHVLIDEGQDFPVSFYKLCYQLANGQQDRKSIVWAYDELQDIMNVKIRQPEELFGLDAQGRALIDLDRSSAHLPPGATNDAVLSKCYRNQRDVLVSAHALGFGVYGNIVQLLESAEHWQDVGYEVETGQLQTGQEVRIRRPDANSPVQIADTPEFPLIDWHAADDMDDEIEWVTASISRFLAGGLTPEEVVVISLDDRHAKSYLSQIAESLALAGISSNNVIADPYNEPPFTIAGKVTLSTVYRAKGNEAAAVFAVGIDAVEKRSRSGRNKIFTAFTRSKAWLRVSGIGKLAESLFAELDTAKNSAPLITFKMPDLNEVETIQRGFSRKQAKAKAAREEYIRTLMDAGYSDEEIEQELAIGLKGE